MSPAETSQTAIVDRIAANAAAMESLLQSIVDIDSGSDDNAGVEQVALLLADFLIQHGIKIRRVPTHSGAAMLEARLGDTRSRPVPLLMGHLDTVFARGTAAARPYRSQGYCI